MANSTLSLGSNIGNKLKYISNAVEIISQEIGPIKKTSSDFESEAWGNVVQEDYINKVILVETSLNPFELLSKIHHIENKMGRKRRTKWGSRIIDIDILFYDDLIENHKNLIIPHPLISKRNFVLAPLYQIDPKFMHPVLNKSVEDLYIDCQDTAKVCELVSVF